MCDPGKNERGLSRSVARPGGVLADCVKDWSTLFCMRRLEQVLDHFSALLLVLVMVVVSSLAQDKDERTAKCAVFRMPLSSPSTITNKCICPARLSTRAEPSLCLTAPEKASEANPLYASQNPVAPDLRSAAVLCPLPSLEGRTPAGWRKMPRRQWPAGAFPRWR